eukprot:3941620-Rhodomonas_salina.2
MSGTGMGYSGIGLRAYYCAKCSTGVACGDIGLRAADGVCCAMCGNDTAYAVQCVVMTRRMGIAKRRSA